MNMLNPFRRLPVMAIRKVVVTRMRTNPSTRLNRVSHIRPTLSIPLSQVIQPLLKSIPPMGILRNQPEDICPLSLPPIRLRQEQLRISKAVLVREGPTRM